MLTVIIARKTRVMIIAVFLPDSLFFSGFGAEVLAVALLLRGLLANIIAFSRLLIGLSGLLDDATPSAKLI